MTRRFSPRRKPASLPAINLERLKQINWMDSVVIRDDTLGLAPFPDYSTRAVLR